MTMSDDNIFREVDEDLRREQLAAMWDKYGVYVLIAAAVIVAVVAGYNVYHWWADKRAAETGAAFYQATQLVDEKKQNLALDAFAKIAKSGGGGYQTLADLQMASIQAREGHKKEAVELYEKVASGGADEMLRDFAKLEAATLRLDEADPAEIRKRVEGLNTDTNPWRYSAQELLGLAAFRSGNMAESEKIFSQIIGDPSAPAEIRRRAETMLALLVKTPKKTSAAPEQKSSQTQ